VSVVPRRPRLRGAPIQSGTRTSSSIVPATATTVYSGGACGLLLGTLRAVAEHVVAELCARSLGPREHGSKPVFCHTSKARSRGNRLHLRMLHLATSQHRFLECCSRAPQGNPALEIWRRASGAPGGGSCPCERHSSAFVKKSLGFTTHLIFDLISRILLGSVCCAGGKRGHKPACGLLLVCVGQPWETRRKATTGGRVIGRTTTGVEAAVGGTAREPGGTTIAKINMVVVVAGAVVRERKRRPPSAVTLCRESASEQTVGRSLSACSACSDCSHCCGVAMLAHDPVPTT